MSDFLTGGKLFLSPGFLNSFLNDIFPTWALPYVAHDLCVPIPAHLSTSVKAFKAV